MFTLVRQSERLIGWPALRRPVSTAVHNNSAAPSHQVAMTFLGCCMCVYMCVRSVVAHGFIHYTHTPTLISARCFYSSLSVPFRTKQLWWERENPSPSFLCSVPASQGGFCRDCRKQRIITGLAKKKPTDTIRHTFWNTCLKKKHVLCALNLTQYGPGVSPEFIMALSSTQHNTA